MSSNVDFLLRVDGCIRDYLMRMLACCGKGGQPPPQLRPTRERRARGPWPNSSVNRSQPWPLHSRRRIYCVLLLQRQTEIRSSSPELKLPDPAMYRFHRTGRSCHRHARSWGPLRLDRRANIQQLKKQVIAGWSQTACSESTRTMKPDHLVRADKTGIALEDNSPPPLNLRLRIRTQSLQILSLTKRMNTLPVRYFPSV